LCRDFQDPPQLEAEPVDVAIGLAQGVANGVAAQGIVFRFFLGIIERDALKTVGALVHQLPRQDACLVDLPDSHGQRIVGGVAAQRPFGDIAVGVLDLNLIVNWRERDR